MTGLDWLPGVERIDCGAGDGGSYVPGPFRLVLHRTEGGSIEGAVAAYRANRSTPHGTVDLRRRRAVQHLPFTRAARALRNAPGGVETNRQGALQIEVVGYSRDSPNDADADLVWFGELLRPVLSSFGVQPTAVPFYGEGCGWTLAVVGARQRLNAAQWRAYNGVCAHQHVPENTHWDVGAFKVAAFLGGVTGTITTPPAGPSGTGEPVLVSAPVPAPAPAPAPARPSYLPVVVDGQWGPATTRALQFVLPVAPVDGLLGPVTYRALQLVVGTAPDGLWGPNSKRALQRFLGVAVDGIVGPATIRALQARLNTGRL